MSQPNFCAIILYDCDYCWSAGCVTSRGTIIPVLPWLETIIITNLVGCWTFAISLCPLLLAPIVLRLFALRIPQQAHSQCFAGSVPGNNGNCLPERETCNLFQRPSTESYSLIQAGDHRIQESGGCRMRGGWRCRVSGCMMLIIMMSLSFSLLVYIAAREIGLLLLLLVLWTGGVRAQSSGWPECQVWCIVQQWLHHGHGKQRRTVFCRTN